MKRKFEVEFQTSITDEQFDSMVLQVLESYGRPLGLEFKQEESGSKMYSDGGTKPVEKFWYAAKTTKYENGYFLIVEVVPDGSTLAVSSFSMVNFPLGVPENLR
jgi:hypothetical protein